jgi:hypothetical protein
MRVLPIMRMSPVTLTARRWEKSLTIWAAAVEAAQSAAMTPRVSKTLRRLRKTGVEHRNPTRGPGTPGGNAPGVKREAGGWGWAAGITLRRWAYRVSRGDRDCREEKACVARRIRAFRVSTLIAPKAKSRKTLYVMSKARQALQIVQQF